MLCTTTIRGRDRGQTTPTERTVAERIMANHVEGLLSEVLIRSSIDTPLVKSENW